MAPKQRIAEELEQTVCTRCDSCYRSSSGSHRHAVAALGARLREGDVATAAGRLGAQLHCW